VENVDCGNPFPGRELGGQDAPVAGDDPAGAVDQDWVGPTGLLMLAAIWATCSSECVRANGTRSDSGRKMTPGRHSSDPRQPLPRSWVPWPMDPIRGRNRETAQLLLGSRSSHVPQVPVVAIIYRAAAVSLRG
jgi:hypothetical protein